MIERFKNMKTSRQLNIVYVAAVFVPILAIGIFLIANTYNMLFNHHMDLLNSSNNSSKMIMNEINGQIYNISDSIAYDSRTISMLGGMYGSEREFRDAARDYTVIDSFVENYSQIGSITIYTNTPYTSNFKYFRPVTEEIEQTDWYQKAIGQYSPFYQLIVETNLYKNVEYSYALVRKITVLGSGCQAVMVIKVSENYLESRLGGSDYLTFISFGDDIFYSTKRDWYGKKLPFEVDYGEDYYSETFNERFENELCLGEISSLNLKYTDTKAYVTTLDRNAMRSIIKTLLVTVSTVLVALIVPAIFMKRFAHSFVTQVSTLRDEMHKASNEEYDIRTDFSGSYELKQAYDDLLIMVHTIEQQKETMYEAMLNEKQLQNEQQEMEFKMLASQINPHFLYNTLETLRMKAFTAGDKEVATGIKLLGKMLRYVLVNIGTTYTSLQNELEHIDTYIRIQKIRFDERVNYQLEIEDDIDTQEYMLLPLLLQPIVENAVVHGLENVDAVGCISIHIYEEHDNCEHLIIDVSDNGNGMTREQLDMVRKNIAEDSMSKHSSIGMSNIDQRIKLCYGEKYGLHIESEEGKGTTVTVLLPRHSAKEQKI